MTIIYNLKTYRNVYELLLLIVLLFHDISVAQFGVLAFQYPSKRGRVQVSVQVLRE
jgi:hypothetical protein